MGAVVGGTALLPLTHHCLFSLNPADYTRMLAKMEEKSATSYNSAVSKLKSAHEALMLATATSQYALKHFIHCYFYAMLLTHFQ